MSYMLGQLQVPLPQKSRTERVIEAILKTAEAIWPRKTREAEEWLREQAVQYGVDYTKVKAREQIRRGEQQLAENPWFWGLLGAGAVWLLTRR